MSVTPLARAENQTDRIPSYTSAGNEVDIFESAYRNRLPLLIKGPTGCGKTRFIEHMAARLGRPLYTVSCHDDLSAADLVGRHLIGADGTYWADGPLTQAVRHGGICYLDEIVEARTDSTVIIHPLTDHRRQLPLEKKGQEIEAHEDFMLVISYNPGYQTVLKDLKPSTKQRFIGIDFNYPNEEIELKIIRNEVPELAEAQLAPLVAAGRRARTLKDHGLDEATSTRALVYAANMIAAGITPLEACKAALVSPVTDDTELAEALLEIIRAHFP